MSKKIKPLKDKQLKHNEAYWYVFDECDFTPYYFKTEKEAKEYAKQENMSNYFINVECVN